MQCRLFLPGCKLFKWIVICKNASPKVARQAESPQIKPGKFLGMLFLKLEPFWPRNAVNDFLSLQVIHQPIIATLQTIFTLSTSSLSG